MLPVEGAVVVFAFPVPPPTLHAVINAAPPPPETVPFSPKNMACGKAGHARINNQMSSRMASS